MGFEPTTLRGLVGRSNHWATGDYGEHGSNVGLDKNCITQSHSQINTGPYDS